MPVAILVIDGDAALQKFTQARRIKRIGQPRIVERFGLPQQEAPVAIGAGDECGAGIGGEGQGAFKAFGAGQQHFQRVMPEPFKDQHLCAGEQGGVESKAGVLGGRAHQRDCAAFDEGQEAVLLRTVEAVDFVHEQQRLLAGLRHPVSLGKGLFQVGHARKHRADRGEAHSHLVCEQSRNARLAGARWPPQDHARQFSCVHHPPDRAVGSGQMFLPDHLCQRARAQPVGQWCVGPHGILHASARRGIISEQVCHLSVAVSNSSENAIRHLFR